MFLDLSKVKRFRNESIERRTDRWTETTKHILSHTSWSIIIHGHIILMDYLLSSNYHLLHVLQYNQKSVLDIILFLLFMTLEYSTKVRTNLGKVRITLIFMTPST